MAIKQDKNGLWYYRIRYKDHYGKWHEKKKIGFARKKDAKEAEDKERIRLKESPQNSMTFKELYYDYLNYSSSRMKESTLQTTKYKIDKQVLPYFSDMKISKIRTIDIKNWQDELNKQNYSIKYKRGIFNCLTKILNYGIKYHGLKENVAVLNGNFANPNIIEKEMEIWTLEEFNKFINVIPENDEKSLIFKSLYTLIFWTGCRRGEAQALTWNDVANDFTHLMINKTCSHKIKGKSYVITPPKTKSSIRKVKLTKQVQDILYRLYEQEKQRDGFSNRCFIFGFDKPIADTTIEARKNKYCKQAKVKQIRIHDFRHSHASILIARGNSIVRVARRLGHSDIAMTLNTYSHLLPDDEDDLIEDINSIENESVPATNLPQKPQKSTIKGQLLN